MYQANWDAMDKLIERWRPKAASAVTQIKKLKERIDVLEEELEVILMERIRDKSNAERYERMIHKREKEIASAKKQIEDLQNMEAALRDRQTRLKRDISLIDDILKEGRMSEAHLRMLADTEGLVLDAKEIKEHAAKGGIFGVEKADWVAELEKQNPLKAAEMSLEDDYGMIDGIINNGPKEDKASEKGGKTSIMDRLKSAKTAQQTDKPSPHKEKKSEREI